MPDPQSRSVRGWVVVNAEGWPLAGTSGYRRRDAIAAFAALGWGETYKQARRKYGVQVVRCTITTDPTDPPAPTEGA